MKIYTLYTIKKGYVEKEDRGYYVLEDPVFERWLKVFILPSFQS